MYDFNGRTVQPLEAAAPPGYHNSTSRSQTSSAIGTLKRYYAVIPMVTFLRWSLSIPQYNNGSLWPAKRGTRAIRRIAPHPQAPVRVVALSVKLIFFGALPPGGGSVGPPSGLILCAPSILFRRRSPQPNYLTCTVLDSNLNKKSGFSYKLGQEAKGPFESRGPETRFFLIPCFIFFHLVFTILLWSKGQGT